MRVVKKISSKKLVAAALMVSLNLAAFGTAMFSSSSVAYAAGHDDRSIHVTASSVVCDKESDLPNWGIVSGEITSHTAEFWVAHHASCRLAGGWNFQYAGGNSSNPGDTLTGEAGGYTTFGATNHNGQTSVDIPLYGNFTNSIHFREVLKDGYIPFTYQSVGNKNTNNASAEFYCANDVHNYDNFDFIANPDRGANYNCVGFNVPKESTLLRCSDNIDNDGDHLADLSDPDCASYKPTLMVIKHVVGGGMTANQFTIHITSGISITGSETGVLTTFDTPTAYSVTEDANPNYAATLFGSCAGTLTTGAHATCTITNTYVPIAPPQVCPEGTIGTFPDCTPTDSGNTIDVCPNIEGSQSVVPQGDQLVDGLCAPIVPPQVCAEGTTGTFPDCQPAVNTGGIDGTTDLCPNIDGNQSTVPEGMTVIDNSCIESDAPSTDTSNTGGAGSGGGSSNFDYWGCTDTAATNFNRLANKDDGSCTLPGGSNSGTVSTSTGENNSDTGEVLGASTTTPDLPLPLGCSEYIHSYMGYGKNNDKDEVSKVQTFLNKIMGANIPVTGFYGTATKAWVKLFQAKYHEDIIKPWYDAGYKGKDIEKGTGYLYKTTQREINLLECSALNIPIPDLTSDL